MAKSHVIQYFLEVENEYLELVENLAEFRELAAENKISEDDVLDMVKQIDAVKENYTRIGYIVFLLNQPQRKSKKPTKQELGWYNALRFASKEAILDESKDVLCKLKELIKEGKITDESKYTAEN